MQKEFPIPVVGVGAGSQPEDEQLEYLSMPQGMETFHAPQLPEPEEILGREQAHQTLRACLAALAQVMLDGVNRSIDLGHLDGADLQLINQVMGEGEVSARVLSESDASGAPAADGLELRVQESVFAGIWRVIEARAGVVVSDRLELGFVPQALKKTAILDRWSEAQRQAVAWQGPLPPNVQNAPALLVEIADQWRSWTPAQPAHVINLTLLPVSVEDIGFLDHHLGTGRVLILSRGYGNCRISNTCTPHCWRVVYYNSQDVVILNTVEITELPEVALAAPEDLADSHARLADVLQWVEQG